MISTVLDFIANIGLEIAKQKIKKKINEEKLKNEIIVFVERQSKYIDRLTIPEEIDYQGLKDFILNEVIETANARIFDPNKKTRRQARNRIQVLAAKYSHAYTPESKKYVETIINSCFDILREFYSRDFTAKDYLFMQMITDNVASENEQILQSINKMQKKLEEHDDNLLYQISESGKILESSDLSLLSSEITQVLVSKSKFHPLFPLFSYDYVNGEIVSVPMSDEAEKKHPSKIEIDGTAVIQNNGETIKVDNPFDYSYRHQIPVVIDVKNAIKMLGEVVDPVQHEASKLIGKTIIATPPKISRQVPCSLKVNGQTFFDYILMQIQEIDDDGTYVISNKLQDVNFKFEVRINPADKQKNTFHVSKKRCNKTELILYLQFINEISKGNEMDLFMLESKQNLVSARINTIEMQNESGFHSLEEEIDFLKRLCLLEEYFHVELNPEDRISKEEFDWVMYISSLISDGNVERKWKKSEITVTLDYKVRQWICSLNSSKQKLGYKGTYSLDIFGETLSFCIWRQYNSVQIYDYEKTKRKVDVLDDGDNLKLVICPLDDDTIIDTLNIPEGLKALDNE